MSREVAKLTNDVARDLAKRRGTSWYNRHAEDVRIELASLWTKSAPSYVNYPAHMCGYMENPLDTVTNI